MGVRGLQTFLEQQCPVAIRRVSLKDMGNTFRQANPSITEPILVVDGHNCISKLQRGLDWVCSGQWLELIQRLQTFVQSIQSLNIKLIFFFDGSTPESKLDRWLAKRRENMEDIIQIFELIKSGNDVPDTLFQVPASTSVLIRFALKYSCQVPVYTVIGDSDRIISTFAVKHKCLAILAQDSDFLIYNTVPVISIKELDISTLETVLYDRDIFCSRMNISVAQLPLLACLMGNDYLFEDRGFHKHLLQKYFKQLSLTGKPSYRSNVIACVLLYIRSLHLKGDVSDLNLRLSAICQYVFGNTNQLKNLTEGLRAYELCFSECELYRDPFGEQSPVDLSNPEGIFDYILQKSITSDISQQIFNYIIFGTWAVSITLEDDSNNLFAPTVIVFRPIRTRLYDLIFTFRDKHIQDKIAIERIGRPPITKDSIDEYWVSSKKQYVRPDRIYRSPVRVNGNVPDLWRLWTDTNPSSEQLKWETIQACLNLTQSIECLKEIPDNFKLLCMILNYLIQSPDVSLDTWETDAFLVQAVLPRALDIEWIRDLKVKPYDDRAVHLTSIFFGGTIVFIDVVSICGEPFHIENILPWDGFDGKRFHHCYTEIKRGISIEDLCSNDRKSMDQFELLKKSTYENLHKYSKQTY